MLVLTRGSQPQGELQAGVEVDVTAQPAGSLDVSEPPAEHLDTHAVVLRYQRMVYGIALTHTRCQGDADDVFQEVFLTYHRRQPECRSEEHRKAWLITTTLNCARHVVGSSWRTRVVPLSSASQQASPAQFEFATLQQKLLFEALRELAETYRVVLYLFYFEDLPIARIAEVLGQSEATVKMRLSRARQQMRDRLTGGVFDE